MTTGLGRSDKNEIKITGAWKSRNEYKYLKQRRYKILEPVGTRLHGFNLGKGRR
jgi:hypothetical protein